MVRCSKKWVVKLFGLILKEIEMRLVGQEDVNATSYKKAAVILFDNTNIAPVMMAIMYSVYAFARTYQPPAIEEQPNGND